MPPSSPVTKIFWPSDLLDTNDSALILGWQNSTTDLFVIDLVSNIYRDGLEAPLDIGSLVTKYPISRVTQFCGSQPLSILGQLANSPTKPSGDHILQCYIDHDSIFPRFHTNEAIQLIIFDRPDPLKMQYFSLQPIPFDLSKHLNLTTLNDDLIFKPCISTHDQSLTQLHINQMNCAREIAVVLQKKLPKLGSRRYRNRSQSFHESVTTSMFGLMQSGSTSLRTTLRSNYFYIKPRLLVITQALIALELFAINTISRILTTPIHGLALIDISVTARELDFRIMKLRSWPKEYSLLRSRKRDWASITSTHPDYIKFYNSMWLIANDLIFGLYIVSFCFNNEELIASTIQSTVRTWSIGKVMSMMFWLKGYPAGLKLNSELAGFTGDLFLWLLEAWSHVLTHCDPFIPLIIRGIGFAGFMGASMSISLISDMSSLLTLHLHLFYITSARLYEWQLTILISLFHLFRGQKRNVLRKRIDSCAYDLDQLLLGTILFTLLAFLFPTVLVFYLTFAFFRIALKLIKTAMDMCLAFLVQFPLFAILLRIKDAKRLPGGIRLRLLECQGNISCLYIESKPLSFSLMFRGLVERQKGIMGRTIHFTTVLRELSSGRL